MPKIWTVVGTRPNFIKITRLESEIKKQIPNATYTLIHTGQHYDGNMSSVFFEELKLKTPDFFLEVGNSDPGEQITKIIRKLTRLLDRERPDILIVVGDVNSTLAAAIAAKLSGILLAHIESGLRSFDESMPEELNRIITDRIADIHFVSEQSGMDNLRDELPSKEKLFIVGNTMIDALVHYESQINKSEILEKLNLKNDDFILMTLHRPSNVDGRDQLENVLRLLEKLVQLKTVIFPVHPRTAQSFNQLGLSDALHSIPHVVLLPPLGYFEFQKLVKEAHCIVTDSGGIQEETSFWQIPCFTLRTSTERPVTIELGTNTLIPPDSNEVFQKIEDLGDNKRMQKSSLPLWDGLATERLIKILSEIL